jgi:ATP-dependent Clp protease ATP-binding subunit ClpX
LNKLSKEIMSQFNESSNELFLALPTDETESTSTESKQHKTVIDHIKTFNLKPKDIKTYLDRFVVSQDDAKKALAIAICDHYNVIKESFSEETINENYGKQNILMIGPTGVGKTYMVKKIAELIGVPFIKSDEIDKITGTQSKHHKDVSGRGVQTNLLKIMEETDVQIRPPWDIQAQIKQMMGSKNTDKNEVINTRHILFIMSGAFNELGEIVKSRLSGATIGFERESAKHSDDYEKQLMQSLRTQDLVKFGLEPEFAGRLPVRVALNQLSINDLFDVLTQAEGSVLEKTVKSFKRFNIDLAFTTDALMEISRIAHDERIGARALSSTLEKTFREFKFELPSSNVTFVLATKELISSPTSYLKKYLNMPEKQFENDIEGYIEIINSKKNHNLNYETIIKEFNADQESESIIEFIENYIALEKNNVTNH